MILLVRDLFVGFPIGRPDWNIIKILFSEKLVLVLEEAGNS